MMHQQEGSEKASVQILESEENDETIVEGEDKEGMSYTGEGEEDEGQTSQDMKKVKIIKKQ